MEDILNPRLPALLPSHVPIHLRHHLLLSRHAVLGHVHRGELQRWHEHLDSAPQFGVFFFLLLVFDLFLRCVCLVGARPDLGSETKKGCLEQENEVEPTRLSRGSSSLLLADSLLHGIVHVEDTTFTLASLRPLCLSLGGTRGQRCLHCGFRPRLASMVRTCKGRAYGPLGDELCLHGSFPRSRRCG